jgi:AcrR family transcriptional regulator
MASYSDEVRNRIIETSRKFFARFGLFKTTVDEISQAMHMGKSSLYYYFKNKEEIFKAVIEKEVDILSERVRKAVEEAPTPQEKLKVFGIQRMKARTELANAYSALKDEYLNHYSFVQDVRRDVEARELEYVKKILLEGREKGIFSFDDAGATARGIATAFKGLEYEWALQGDDGEFGKDIDPLLAVLLHGIMNRGEQK